LDVKEYISSGILDSYVLGSSSEREMREVECMAMIYPEIKEELEKLQLIFEKFAISAAVDPPADLKSKILGAIDGVNQKPAVAGTREEADSGKGLKSIVPHGWKIAVAASVVLLLAMGLLWMNSYHQKNFFKQKLVAVDSENRQLKNQISRLEEYKKNEEHLTYILGHPATKKVSLAGTKLSPESAASVYWNTETSEVFLKVNLLPSPGPDNQYQLWAIVDSKPLDMGVFEIDLVRTGIKKMPYLVENATAFAITLEKKGGSSTPTLSAMYVAGNI
jgi:anti-sigma-K factor RskA